MQEILLFKIVYYALDKGKVTTLESSKNFEVSIRTIYPDIDMRSSSGLSIYAQTERNGGIQLYDDFVLDNVVLSMEEKQEILSTLQSLMIVGTSEKDTLTKLSALFHMYSENWFEILYVSSNSEKRSRSVHPIKLLYKSKSWY